MQHILVPTDFSANADNALTYAVRLAQFCNAKLTILHIYHVTDLGPNLPQEIYLRYAADREQAAQKRMEVVRKKLAASPAIQCQYVVKAGTAIEQIIQYAKEGNADLIVMGTKGANGVVQEWIGSTTASLIEKRQFPVLAIPAQATFPEPATIGLAFDFQEIGQIPILQPLADLSILLRARLKAFHIDTQSKLDKDQERKITGSLRECFSSTNLSFYFVKGKDVLRAVDDFVMQESITILAMVARKKTFWEQLTQQSFTRKIVLHTHTPLLAIPEPDVVR